MRWVFFLLSMLNAFYCAWYQQSAPLKTKEILSLSPYKGIQQHIRLLSESAEDQSVSASVSSRRQCIYLGGGITESEARTVEQRLVSLDIRVQFGKWSNGSKDIFWLKVAPESRRLVEEALLERLRQDFPELKSQIMSCEAIATSG